jgi:RNA polymerase-binding transcription factor DksA
VEALGLKTPPSTAQVVSLEGKVEGKVKLQAFDVNSREFAHFESISNALIRLDKGTYGRCERCGKRIESDVLAETPWAIACVDCRDQAPQP